MPMRSVTHIIFSVEIFFIPFLFSRHGTANTLAVLLFSFRGLLSDLYIYHLLFSTHTVNLKSVHNVHPHFNRIYVFSFLQRTFFDLSHAPTISLYFSFFHTLFFWFRVCRWCVLKLAGTFSQREFKFDTHYSGLFKEMFLRLFNTVK